MIESTQASALQAACGAKPDVCSAQVAPCCGERREQALQQDADDDDQDERQPDGFGEHAAQGGREHLRKRFDGGVDHAQER